MTRRCGWARDPLDVQHHDDEWGVPEHDDRRLFELLILEGAQAGLSWLTILRKRDTYRKAFAGFDPEKVARFSDSDVRRLLRDRRIVRNRAKIEATITNARAFCAIQREYGSFAAYVWGFVDGRPVQNAWTSLSQVPSETHVSRALSRDLTKRGFRFVGPTICYRSCSPSEWSTITSLTASGGPRCAGLRGVAARTAHRLCRSRHVSQP
jgi:DNA-3-methyladenine glycosylase I